MDAAYHYPPELLDLLVDTIARLRRSKADVLAFFREAGVPAAMIEPLKQELARNRDALSKFAIVRRVLERVNELGDATLAARREIIKRVVEYEDFTSCWPKDQLEAQGLVARVRHVVNVKDSFTRMRQEREREESERRRATLAAAETAAQREREREALRTRFAALFAMTDPSQRGIALEPVLNDLFAFEGIRIRESFRRVSEHGEGTLEQIDGVIELDGHVWLVEMKWREAPLGTEHVSPHLVRIYGRADARGLFISYSSYTPAAIDTVRGALRQRVVAMCELREILALLDRRESIIPMLRRKAIAAEVDLNPYEPYRVA